MAARDRLRGSLQASLIRLSLDFNTEIATAARAMLPADSGSPAAENAVAEHYTQWKKTARHAQMFRRIAIAEPGNRTVALRSLNLEKDVFEPHGVAAGLDTSSGAPGKHDVPGTSARARLPRTSAR